MSKKDYDLIVIGAGSAGLTAAGLAASLGARTALIEAERPGGDCTWHGCVPSKALLHIAEFARAKERAAGSGVSIDGVHIDGPAVMRRVRSIRRTIYEESDSPEVLRSFGIDLIEGRGRFSSPHSIVVTNSSGDAPIELSSKYFIIATGAVPQVPEIAGISTSEILTTDTVFDLQDLPDSLLVVGAGPVGLELGQAFTRLGVRVTIVERGGRETGMFEPEHQVRLFDRLRADGLVIHTDSVVDSYDGKAGRAAIRSGSKTTDVDAERILAATGRRVRVEHLGLERAGVHWSLGGIGINHSCQTSAPHIYACGDVAEGLQFTHVAEDMARTAVKRILLKIPTAHESQVVPRILYTDPELGRVGSTSAELKARSAQFRTIRFPYSRIDRARITGQTDGEILLHYGPVGGRVLGAHIIGVHAGELLQEFVLAMQNSLSLRELSATMHAYPGWMLGVRRAADQIYIQTGSPTPLKFLGSLFGYRGEVSDRIGGDEVV